ncbi:UDP-N-acetylmuramate--L-alanine ligase [Pseudoramibacter alactolyticus]|nr:UDP-N-acetylmuramate--L-alanine ligase [Pseudoramibacter alactolyticus]
MEHKKLDMKAHLKEKFGRPIQKIYFIGIGGSSMSGLALIAIDQGFDVAGSDIVSSKYTEKLAGKGATIHIGQRAENIGDDIDMAVFTAAVHEDNPEMIRANALDIPLVERSDYLGLLSQVFPKTIGVAGTHGKTTTSSMIATLLHCAEMDPSVSIGGNIGVIGGNATLGKSDYLVIESCEYVDSFLKTEHFIGVITNIEEDHLDYFKGGLKQIKHSFHDFGSILPPDGLMIAYGDSDDVLDVVSDLACQVITYGLSDKNEWVARNITYNDEGNPFFDAYHNGTLYGRFALRIPGQHNVLNAMACIACADYLNIQKETVEEALDHFGGAKRRFEFRGAVGGINVYEDYAHHPTELKVVIDACLNHAHNKLWVVYQPHSYSRIYYLFDEFVKSFEKVDKLVISEIYSNRETNDWDIFPEDLAKRIKQNYQVPAVVISEFADIVKFLTDNVEADDLVLVAGAGDINKVAYMLVDALREKYPDAPYKAAQS